MVHCSILP